MPGVLNSLGTEGLPLNETTLADHLKAQGYATLAIGAVLHSYFCVFI
jgi:arylsulfatase A-like enzyme